MLIQKKKTKSRVVTVICAGVSLASCVAPLAGTPVAALRPDDYSGEKRERLALFGHGPVYAVEDPRSAQRAGLPMVAQVKLWKDGEELTAAMIYDSEVTGELVYTLETQPLHLSELSKPSPGRLRRQAFEADVERGYVRATGDSFMHAVGVKVSRIISPPTPATPVACPYLLFGSDRELFLLQTQPPPQQVVQLASVRMGWTGFTSQQANAIKQGLCVQPKGQLNELRKGDRYSWHAVLLGKQDMVETEVVDSLPLALLSTEPSG